MERAERMVTTISGAYVLVSKTLGAPSKAPPPDPTLQLLTFHLQLLCLAALVGGMVGFALKTLS